MKKILLLEDCEKTRRWIIDLLLRVFPGSEIHETGAISEFTRTMETEKEFDLALIDLQLPDGSGFDALRDLTHLSPRTLGVVLTVSLDDCQIVSALAAGAEGYLLKEQAEETNRGAIAGASPWSTRSFPSSGPPHRYSFPADWSNFRGRRNPIEERIRSAWTYLTRASEHRSRPSARDLGKYGGQPY